MLRTPLRLLATSTLNSAVSGGSGNYSDTFVFPFQDYNGLVVKLRNNQTLTTTGSYTVYLQTTDDGGTTWYDMVASTAINSGTAATNAAAQWLAFPVDPTEPISQPTLSDGTLAAGTASGLPLLSNMLRVKWVVSGTVTSVTANATIYANSQSNRA